jgi:hypothetical protein
MARRRLDLTPQQVAAAQAVYYAPTSIWALVHRPSFEAVTGPKADYWLVRTVALLLLSISGGLALAARRDEVSTPVAVIATATAASLSGVDVVYVAKRRIRWTYLLDVPPNTVLLAAWWRAYAGGASGRRSRSRLRRALSR